MTSLILLILKSLVCHNAPLIPTGSSLGHYEFCVFNFADISSLTQQTHRLTLRLRSSHYFRFRVKVKVNLSPCVRPPDCDSIDENCNR